MSNEQFLTTIKNVFNDLDDKSDLFEHISHIIPLIKHDNLIAYKEKNEYGTLIKIFNINGVELTELFITNYKDERFSSKPYYISSCTHFGLNEKIFSNRTEYYICDKYYSSSLDERLISYIKLVNHFILEEKTNEELQNFIESDEIITILQNNTFSYEEDAILEYFHHEFY